MTPQQFEAATGLSGYAAANLLRVSKSKWYEWSAGSRVLPPYIEASMESHLALHRAGLLAPVIARRLALTRRPARSHTPALR